MHSKKKRPRSKPDPCCPLASTARLTGQLINFCGEVMVCIEDARSGLATNQTDVVPWRASESIRTTH